MLQIDKIKERLNYQIGSHPVLLFMKGNPDAPQCGFSAKTCQVLKACGANFDYVDVLYDIEARAVLPRVTNWPTFPQLFINGELLGGSDIAWEMYQSGELQKQLEQVKKTDTVETEPGDAKS